MRCSVALGLAVCLFVGGGCDASDGTVNEAPDASSHDAAAPIQDAAPPPPEDGGSVQPVDATPPADTGVTPPVDAAMPVKPGDPIDAGPTSPGTITVTPGTTAGQIPAGFIGLSYEKTQLTTGLFSASDAPLIALFQLVGGGVLRMGGNQVDRSEWYSAPSSDASADSTITKAEVDDLSGFAKASGWKVVYGVNMKLSSPAVAADETSYAVTSLGASLAGLELGNEPDLYSGTVMSPTWSYSAFKTQWSSFASAVLAASPGAPLTGPASAANYSSWTVPFASDLGSKVQLLTQHYYRGNGQDSSSTVQELLTPDANLSKELDALHTAAQGANIAGGFRLAECNSYYNGGAPNVSDAYGTALWVIDFLFQNAQHGSAGVNFHGGGSGPGYTPIADSNGAVVEARPEFYGILLFSMAGQGTLFKTAVSVTNSLNVTAYAVGASDGSTNVVVVSKDANTGIHATIDLGATATTAGVLYLQGPALDATSGVTLGSSGISPAGSFTPTGLIPLAVSGTKVTVDVPAAAAAIIHAK
ncbi:MAG TPA: hypothetical protein VGI39_21505 [Polyangiaceae bacterium]|jgi:hypothetical protein